jgi:hypothetical protein
LPKNMTKTQTTIPIIYPKPQHNTHPQIATFAKAATRNNKHTPAYLYKEPTQYSYVDCDICKSNQEKQQTHPSIFVQIHKRFNTR